MNPPLTPEQLTALKEQLQKQTDADNAAIAESEIVLHRLAGHLHAAALQGGNAQSYAASLTAAAAQILGEAKAGFPDAARGNLLRYAPSAAAAAAAAGADPIAAAETAAEAKEGAAS